MLFGNSRKPRRLQKYSCRSSKTEMLRLMLGLRFSNLGTSRTGIFERETSGIDFVQMGFIQTIGIVFASQ